MLKLSQRAWNNVIIVSMLILIMLFNFSGNFLNDGSEDVSTSLTLVPANMTITTIEFEQEKVERIGQGWRTLSEKHAKTYSNERLANLVQNWVNAEVRLFDQDLNWNSPTSTVELWFVGQALPTEYQFMQLADSTLVKIDQKTYQLISPNYHFLTLQE
ncbi:hypothetical protein [uncultured Paraglaciecola sp.]|uniref:hypothetical protein n=1 Tax=uncultured Paraglaciecola sp. TaxID=1765024 RepID=UPI0030D7646A|tara:strand:+ start:26042 stop:26515 length:474 start_codon:yes stop_codon:yes gene_type:complete